MEVGGTSLPSPSEQPAAWLEIAVEVAGIDSELAADVMRQVCAGGVATELASRFDAAADAYIVDGDAPAIVRGYLPSSPDSRRIQRSLRLAVSMAPLSASSGPPRWLRPRRLRERSWRDSWKRHFGVLRVGRAIVVAPTWVTYRVKDGETVIRIDPGMAFGTGQHQTTAMCLRALEEHVSPEIEVLDLGCGSGILAIAAARLGARHVVALDTDSMAVTATVENAAANGVAGLIEVREGTLVAAAPGERQFDIIVANISGLTLERLAPALWSALVRGGLLITSGFLEDSVASLSRACMSAGLLVERVVEEGVWRAIIARKDAAG